MSEGRVANLLKAVGPATRKGVHPQIAKPAADTKEEARGLLSRIRGAIPSPKKGKGLAACDPVGHANVRYYKDADELTERLALCCSSIQAGNESLAVKNEVEEILTTLLGDGAIGKAEYRAIRSRFVD